MVVGPCSNLTVGKGEEHTKLCLTSLTQKFIGYYLFKVVVRRKKQSIKTESPALAGQRQIASHEEREREREKERERAREKERERERERTGTDLEFSTFHLLVLTRVFSPDLSSL